jgi:uncharacterized protein (DUF433 family)
MGSPSEMTHKEILDDYLSLEEDDIQACLAFSEINVH